MMGRAAWLRSEQLAEPEGGILRGEEAIGQKGLFGNLSRRWKFCFVGEILEHNGHGTENKEVWR